MRKILIVITALISLPPLASAEIYKCRLQNGNTEISNLPCAIGSETITSRPDERVSESARRQAEREVERMRQYVEKREAAQRAEDTAAREERAASNQRQRNNANPAPATTPRPYASAEECLQNIEGMALEASQRAQMEAECHSIVPPQNVYVPGIGPAYPPLGQTHQGPHQAKHQPNYQPQMPKPEPQPEAPKISMPPLQK
jgi:hypothetical protein